MAARGHGRLGQTYALLLTAPIGTTVACWFFPEDDLRSHSTARDVPDEGLGRNRSPSSWDRKWRCLPPPGGRVRRTSAGSERADPCQHGAVRRRVTKQQYAQGPVSYNTSLRLVHVGHPESFTALEVEQTEIDLHRAHGDTYGDEFFDLQAPAGGASAPPAGT